MPLVAPFPADRLDVDLDSAFATRMDEHEARLQSIASE
jgi:hypothetical protein